MLGQLRARGVRDARAAGQGLWLLREPSACEMCAQLWGREASSARDARAAGRGPVAGKWGPAQCKKPELLKMQRVRCVRWRRAEQPAARERALLARGRWCARCWPAAGSADLLPAGGKKAGAAAEGGPAARAMRAARGSRKASCARDARAAGRRSAAGGKEAACWKRAGCWQHLAAARREKRAGRVGRRVPAEYGMLVKIGGRKASSVRDARAAGRGP